MSDSNFPATHDGLMQEINASWNELLTYISSLTDEQLTGPTDGAGWTAKDHIIHIAAWETAALALIDGRSKRETLDITPEIWEQDDDPINAVLQARYRDMPLEEVMQTLRDNHEQLMKKLNSMSEEDFAMPHSHYQPDSTSDRRITDFVWWDTAHHYREHIPWIEDIVKRKL